MSDELGSRIAGHEQKVAELERLHSDEPVDPNVDLERFENQQQRREDLNATLKANAGKKLSDKHRVRPAAEVYGDMTFAGAVGGDEAPVEEPAAPVESAPSPTGTTFAAALAKRKAQLAEAHRRTSPQ